MARCRSLWECRLSEEREKHARTKSALRAAVEGLRYIEDALECAHEIDGEGDCNENESETPCHVCAARRALKRAEAARRGK